LVNVEILLVSLISQIKTRNELEKRMWDMNERREKRQYKLTVILVFSVLTLAGVQVIDLVGLI
jgi:hypothetical protein